MKGEPTDRGMYEDMADFDRRSKEADREYRIVKRMTELMDEALEASGRFGYRGAANYLANKIALMEEEKR